MNKTKVPTQTRRSSAKSKKKKKRVENSTLPATCPLASEIVGIDPPPTLIAPNQAVDWLENKAKNRNVDQVFVDSLVRDIQCGNWDVTGATIVFSNEDRIIDGQHRLWAIYMAGISCYCHIIRGVDPKAIVNIDSCRPRSSADQLRILGRVTANDKTVDGILRLILVEEQTTGQFDFSLPGRNRPTNQEIIAVLDRHPIVPDIARKTHMKPQLISRSMLGYFYYVFSRINQDIANTWLSAVKTGENLPKGSPIAKLRDKLYENRIARGEKLTRKTLAALIIKSWNCHLLNKSVSRLAWQSNEQFPKIRRRRG